eukprot:s465_g21.t1
MRSFSAKTGDTRDQRVESNLAFQPAFQPALAPIVAMKLSAFPKGIGSQIDSSCFCSWGKICASGPGDLCKRSAC